MLLIRSARERVAAFLPDMVKRLAEDTIDLPVSRHDIADYLGLTIETVSRCLSQLSEARVIELAGSRQSHCGTGRAFATSANNQVLIMDSSTLSFLQ